MKSGLLWFDNTKGKPLGEKIEVAAKRYQEKYGIKPDTCFVNPQNAPSEPKVNGIEIKTKHTIMPNYLWLGVGKSRLSVDT